MVVLNSGKFCDLYLDKDFLFQLANTHSDSVFLWLSWFLENTEIVFYSSERNVPDQAFTIRPLQLSCEAHQSEILRLGLDVL